MIERAIEEHYLWQAMTRYLVYSKNSLVISPVGEDRSSTLVYKLLDEAGQVLSAWQHVSVRDALEGMLARRDPDTRVADSKRDSDFWQKRWAHFVLHEADHLTDKMLKEALEILKEEPSK